jgi:hypothetical protein
MLKSPVLSTPVQRALAGAAATGGAVQSHNWFYNNPSEGADQATYGIWIMPSEGADQSRLNGSFWNPSEGADQSHIGGYGFHPSEG